MPRPAIKFFVKPSAVLAVLMRLFQERGIDVHEVHQNVNSRRGDEALEIDLLVVNDSDVIAIECKSTLSIDDVNEHLLRLEKLKRLLPAYAEKQAMGAVAAMVLPDNVAQFASRQAAILNLNKKAGSADVRLAHFQPNDHESAASLREMKGCFVGATPSSRLARL